MQGFGIDDVQINQVIINFRSLDKAQWLRKEEQLKDERSQIAEANFHGNDSQQVLGGLGNARTLRHL